MPSVNSEVGAVTNMLGALDNVLIKVFESGLSKCPEVRSYFAFEDEGT